MNKYVVLPASGDLNRGDQALVWETVRLAKNAGFDGEYYIFSADKDTLQSEKQGIKPIDAILKHPSRKFAAKDNLSYSNSILLKWGSVASVDFLFSQIALYGLSRRILKLFISNASKETLTIFEQADAFFVKGGGFIHSSGKITDIYTVYYALYHIILAHALGKPVYVMPNSFGPFNGLGIESLVKNTLEKCKRVLVRESVSLEMVEKIGVSAELVPDLGFYLERNDNLVIPKELTELSNDERKLVAITARPYRFPKSENPEGKYVNYIETLIEFSRWLYSINLMPVFVEQVLSETTHESDITAIQDITSKLNDGEFLIISDTEYDCRDIKKIYSMMDYTVGTRFHSVIFSMSELVPSIAIEYGGNKGKGILKDLHLSEYGLPIEDVSFTKLKEKFNRLLSNEEKVKEQLTINKKKLLIKYTDLVDELSKQRKKDINE